VAHNGGFPEFYKVTRHFESTILDSSPLNPPSCELQGGTRVDTEVSFTLAEMPDNKYEVVPGSVSSNTYVPQTQSDGGMEAAMVSIITAALRSYRRI